MLQSEVEVDMRVYLCGPMDGCTEEEASGWRVNAARHLNSLGIATLDPMDREYSYELGVGDPTSALPALVEEDKIDIEMSDVLLVNYSKVSAGTSMEILLAWQKQKRVIVVAPRELQLSPWVHYHAHKIFFNMTDAYDHIVAFNARIQR
jgi:hypothetical protein